MTCAVCSAPCPPRRKTCGQRCLAALAQRRISRAFRRAVTLRATRVR